MWDLGGTGSVSVGVKETQRCVWVSYGTGSHFRGEVDHYSHRIMLFGPVHAPRPNRMQVWVLGNGTKGHATGSTDPQALSQSTRSIPTLGP